MSISEEPKPNREANAAAEEAERLATEHLAELRARQRVLHLWSVLPGRFPWLTLAAMLASIVVTGAATLWQQRTFELLYVGGSEIWSGGKWWAMPADLLIHVGVMHLTFNLAWIWLLGRLLERELGVARYAGLFLATGVAGELAELAWSGAPGVGLSGVVYGFFGFLAVNGARHADFRRVLLGNTRLWMLGWLVACFFLTHAGVLNVANFAHVGGLVAGALIGLASYPGRWMRAARGGCVALGVVACVPVVWAPWQARWQAERVIRKSEANDEGGALEALSRFRKLEPASVWAWETEFAMRRRRGEDGTCRELLERVVNARPNDATALNALAWLLATSTQEAVRDGTRAVSLARRACELTSDNEAALLDTLAAAYAEAGKFEDAVKWMEKALAKKDGLGAVYERHLEEFRAGRPWRESKRAVKGAEAGGVAP